MFKTRFISMLVLLAAVATGAWADGIVCTASDLGKVLCTDGSIYENVSAATTAGKTAAAVIAYVDETNKNGLAIALADEGSMNWSTAKSTCEGKTAIAGAKWCLPSQDQWKQMFKANGGNDASCTGLNTTITTAGGYALPWEMGDYWSSSESNPGKYAYYVSIDEGYAYWGNGSEDSGNRHQVRACLAFDIAAPAASTYTVTLKEGTDDADNWTITPAEATTTGVAAGTEVKATYGGTKKVKSVKAVKKAAAALIVNPAVGQVIGDDGKNYANAAAATSAGATAVAMIAYVGSDTYDATYKNGLAIALADEGSMNWSTAKSTCEGKTAIAGAKWCLPSQDQWKQMFKANGGNDASCTGLNTTITTAGGYALPWEMGDYWSSSESNPGKYAYYVSIDEGYAYWGNGSEDSGNRHQVRACLAF